MTEYVPYDDTYDLLKPKQRQVIEGVASGMSVTEATEMAGVSRSTYYKWSRDSIFTAELTVARQEFAEAKRGQI